MSGPARARRAMAHASHPRPLHPAGTARALFLGAAAPADPGEALPPALWERLRGHDIAPETLLAAWEVSRWPDAPADDRRALAALMVALGDAVDTGSAYLDLGTAGDGALAARLARLGFDADEARAAAGFAARLLDGQVAADVRALFGHPDARRPFVLAGAALYPEALWTFESRLAAALGPRLTRGGSLGGAAPDALAGSEPALGAEQAAAVDACLSRPLTLVTGGPGTGKTSTIVALLRALSRGGVTAAEVAVAAPTGRAAQRITASLRAAALDGGAELGASTVHRLLGLRPPRRPTLEAEAPEFHAGWRLPHRVVIVDESSMIDLFMMNELAAALRDDAHLVLLGDADQLPSVRLGAVFRDLCAALPEHTRRLTTSYRMNPADSAGAAILQAAQQLNRGAAPDVAARRHARELTWSGVEHLAPDALPDLLARWGDEVLGGPEPLAALAACRFAPDEEGRLPAGAARDHLTAMLERHARGRLLCVTRAADELTSAEAVNEALHARFARAWPGAPRPDDEQGLLPGEPVTILRNDHQRALWNGDQGVVVALGAGQAGPLGVAFGRGDDIVVHGLGELADNVGLGYALTVHRAQGSEYDHVALVLPRADGPLLTREILYTALTRARRGVVLVGALELLGRAAGRKLERASGLGAKLARARAGGPPDR